MLGYLCLTLHAHLPFVRHPEYEDFLEEDWLYEAITETYIPLLDVFDGLERDGVDWRMTMSITPTLASMLADPLLQYRYLRHLEANLIVAGPDTLLLLSGDGEVIEPDENDGVAAIGSGGPYAHAAARALLDHTSMNAAEVARRALEIAASLCVYTNADITVETVRMEPQPVPAADGARPR